MVRGDAGKRSVKMEDTGSYIFIQASYAGDESCTAMINGAIVPSTSSPDDCLHLAVAIECTYGQLFLFLERNFRESHPNATTIDYKDGRLSWKSQNVTLTKTWLYARSWGFARSR